MAKINSIQNLQKIARNHHDDLQLLVNEKSPDSFAILKVAMATCSIAAGADKIFELLSNYIEKRGINAIIEKTGCTGYCYAEPTVEVKLPGKAPVVFSHVTEAKADEIIENYIKNEQEVEGVIELDYFTIDEIN